MRKNKAAEVVADALLGFDFVNIEIGGRFYAVKPPTIKVLCMAIRHFSRLGMEGDNILKAIEALAEQKDDMVKGISCFIAGDESLAPILEETGTFAELKDAMTQCMSLVDISGFQCADLMRNVSMLAAKPKQ